MTHDNERLSDMPGPLRWFLVAFKQVGFPVMVTCFLAYMLFVENVKSRAAMNDFKDVMMSVKTSIDYQTKLFKRKNSDD